MKNNVKKAAFLIGFVIFVMSALFTINAFSQGEANAKDKANVEKIKKEKAKTKIENEIKELEEKEDKIEEQLTKSKKTGDQKKIEELTKALQEIKIQKSARKSFFEKSLTSVAIIFIGLFLFLLMKIGLKQFENLLTKKDTIRESEMALQMKTLSKLFNWLGTITLFGIILYMVLENHGLNVAPLLAGAGIIGLAFGFGGQYLIRDLINGLFILIEGQYRINDVVKIGEYGGLVEDINLRITTLRDLEGRVIIVPNGEVKTVVNYTREYAQALLDIGVAYKENVDQVMDVIKKLGKEMRNDKYFGRLILGDVEMFGVDDFSDSQVKIKFRIKTLPIKQWEVMREFRRRIKNKFDKLGIEIPFPHRTIYWGTGKDNEWVKGFADKIASNK